MKGIKLAAISLAGIAVLLLVIVLLVDLVLSSTRVKSTLADAVFARTQRTLQIDGDISLAFWPNLGIEMGKARLSEFRDTQEFATIDRARISVAALPLLSRQIIVNTIEIDGARITLVKRKDGSLNIDDLRSKDSIQDTAPTTATPFEVTAVKLTNAQLTWRDEGSGDSILRADLDLSTGRIVGDAGSGNYSVDTLAFALAAASGDHAVTLILTTPQLTLAHEVTLDTFAGNIELASPKLQHTINLPLTGRLHADLVKKTLDGALSSQLDQSAVVLKFDVARFTPLDLGFVLDVEHLNADQYLAPTDQTNANEADENGIDLSALQGLNIHGSLHIGALQIANVKSRNFRLVIGEDR